MTTTDCFDDSRRLTGPNLYFAVPAVVLTALGSAARDAAAHAHWAAQVRWMCQALGWPDPQPVARRATLAFVAPTAALYTATEVNEWAWQRSAARFEACAAGGVDSDGDGAGTGDVDGDVADPAAAAAFKAMAQRERSLPRQRLQSAALQHHIVCLEDDDMLSLGAGSGSLCWPRAALPLPMDVPWQRLHDVPTVLVTGSNGKTTTTRLLAAMFNAAGMTCGTCSTEGVVVGGEVVARGDYAGPAGARTVLRHPTVQAAVLETARGGLLRRGLAVPRADVAVVTNVSEDHLGEYGIENLDDIAEAKLVVARAVAASGVLVLNAGDVCLMRVAASLPHSAGATQSWFATDHAHPSLVALRGRHGSTCGAHDGRLLLSDAGSEHDLGEIAAMPLSLGGAAGYNIENMAAAALAACAAGLTIDVIAATLASFGARPADNPGRLERHAYRGATVLVDYAHNPDGLQNLLHVARALQPRRLGLLLGQAGNRDDAAITALARTAAGFTPDLVVIKELPLMLRGRAIGEVPAMLERGLREAGQPHDHIVHNADEAAAAELLLAWAQPGDVLVLPVHTAAVRAHLAALFGR